MADMYDTTVASMKIGVAVPVANHSFKYWDDAGSWVLPTAWTKANLTATRYWTGYDDLEAGLALAGASVPDDTTYRITQTNAQRFWNDDRPTPSPQDIYSSIAAHITFTSPGANANVQFMLSYDSTAAFPSVTEVELDSWSADTTAALTIHTAETVWDPANADKWAKVHISMTDATAIAARFDCIGIMFDPFTRDAYYELTNVWPVNGPEWRYGRGVQITKTPLGTHKAFDPSGGNEKIQLSFRLQDEDIDTYQALKQFFDINKGTPGLPGLPLLIEPNLPGLPPTVMVNFTDKAFPLARQNSRALRYGGTLNLESVW